MPFGAVHFDDVMLLKLTKLYSGEKKLNSNLDLYVLVQGVLVLSRDVLLVLLYPF